MNEKNVPQAIAEVMTELSGVSFSEDKKNLQSNYAYVSSDQVNRRVQGAAGRAGLAIIPSVMEWQTDATEYRNTIRYITTVQLQVELATGTDSRSFMWTGCGVDYGSADKALYKAYTSGMKYFLLRTFLIGADDEYADSEHADQPASKQAQRANGQPPPEVESVPPVIMDELADLLSLVDEYDSLNMGLIANFGAMIPGYNHEKHVRNTIAKVYKEANKTFKWEDGISKPAAKKLLTGLWDRKHEEEQ